MENYVTPRISFLYGGKTFDEIGVKITASKEKILYEFPDGLKVETRIKYYPKQNVIWWTNYWENCGANDSETVSQLWDCDIAVPDEDGELDVYRTNGGNVQPSDYFHDIMPLAFGTLQEHSCWAGRSSYGTAPFFDIKFPEHGLILAVGWTGQWHTKFERMPGTVKIKSGIQNTSFVIHPGETFRTSSTAVMLYSGDQAKAHNDWRSFMREISPIAGGKRGGTCPFSAIFWGGIHSDDLIERWKGIIGADLPFDTCWVDAGWYEPLTADTTADQLAAWQKVGTWDVSKFYHPDGYHDVVKYLSSNGKRFMLWFEPERLKKSVNYWVKTLPDPDDPNGDTFPIALNEDEVADKVIEKISSVIADVGVDIYRQDCNIGQLQYWLANDTPDRVGMTEIHYINNMYRYWDTLLSRFPNLLIDNCASGGHRNDIEMLSRSIPLWRSDFQCKWDCSPEADQIQNTGAAWWYPYSGIGFGPTLGDPYTFRSAYTSGMTVRTWEHRDEKWRFGASNEPISWAKKYFDEYVSIKKFFALDFYELVPNSTANDVWNCTQFADQDTDEGIILGFRRPECEVSEIKTAPGGIKPGLSYTFENADTGETFTVKGEDIIKNGLVLKIPEKRMSLLIRYKGR